MNKRQLIAAFLNAVKNWERFVYANKRANKLNQNGLKSVYTRLVFQWRKEAERLKKLVDLVVLCR